MIYVFWLITAAVVSVITHIAFLLFFPSLNFDDTLNKLASDKPRNEFFVLSQAAQAQIFPEFPRSAIFGICRFDLRSGPVNLHANLPHTFWTLTVYARSGKSLYTVTDRQTGADELNLQLVKAPSVLEAFSAKDDEDVVEASVWRVSSSDPKGFALLWVPTADSAMRQSYIDTLSKSQCMTVKATNASG